MSQELRDVLREALAAVAKATPGEWWGESCAADMHESFDINCGQESIAERLPMSDGLALLMAFQFLRTHGDALLARLAGEGWQPIETAPKDGTRILIDFGRFVGVHAVAWEEAVSGITIWCVDDNKHGPYAVRGYNDPDIRGWMPIAPPALAPAPKETK